MEWQLLFQYVLRFPVVIGEAAELKGRGAGPSPRVEANVKKVIVASIQ